MKILTIVGARPQFIKAAMVSRAIVQFNQSHQETICEQILHTGQHYDENMSDIFFSQMNIPRPTFRLNCGGGSHAEMTGNMLIEIEKILKENQFDKVLVYGDTNSTLAGALAAVKMNIPVIHVEAGLRSFNRQMPEEINRILTDQIADCLFCPTSEAVKNLKNEGITQNVFHVGDVMYDSALLFGKLSETNSQILNQYKLTPQSYLLATVHRAENTDNRERLQNILEAFAEISSEKSPLIIPLHPRTAQQIEKLQLQDILAKNPAIKILPPVSFLDMVALEKNAQYILTDSGGIQKEAYFHQVPCITLRDETEWVETVEAGWNQIAGYKKESILSCLATEIEKKEIKEYGTGRAANDIVKKIWL